jgi:hypothetical protein
VGVFENEFMTMVRVTCGCAEVAISTTGSGSVVASGGENNGYVRWIGSWRGCFGFGF